MNENQAPAQLTPRAIVLAVVLAVLLAAANTYLGLFAGLTIASAIPAAVVSMAVLRVLGGSTILENNIVQTGASAGSSIASGVIFTIPALVILGHWDDFKYLVGARDRRPRRHPRRVLLGAIAPFADRRAEPEVSRGRGRGRSAQGRRQPGTRREAARARRARRWFRQARRGQRLALDPRHRRGERLFRQLARVFRHQPLARAAGCGLHRRPEHRCAGADRRHDFLEHRDSHLRGLLPRGQRRTGADPRRCRRRNDRRRDLGGTGTVPRRRGHAGGRGLGADLDPQFAAVRHSQRPARDARRRGAGNLAHRAGPADEVDPDRARAVHDSARDPVPDDRRRTSASAC